MILVKSRHWYLSKYNSILNKYWPIEVYPFPLNQYDQNQFEHYIRNLIDRLEIENGNLVSRTDLMSVKDNACIEFKFPNKILLLEIPIRFCYDFNGENGCMRHDMQRANLIEVMKSEETIDVYKDVELNNEA